MANATGILTDRLLGKSDTKKEKQPRIRSQKCDERTVDEIQIR